jgi:hypothetical protein
VCLPLYKRIYPKLPTDQSADDDEGTIRSMRATNTTLIVK